jgi:hypothetical protein
MMPDWPMVQVRMPVGGWQLGLQAQPECRTLIEVTDSRGSLVGLIVSIQHQAPSIDEAWHGHVFGPSGRRQWWALAVGHAPTDEGQPTVTFARRTRHNGTTLLPESVDGLWLVHDGLWVAATTGRYTHVRLTTPSGTHVQRLRNSHKRPNK